MVLAGAGGCRASNAPPDYASPQTLRLGWRELDGVDGVGFELDVRLLRITSRGWVVEAAVTNRTDARFLITRPHHRGGTKFGLFVLESDEPDEWKARIAAQRLTPERIATSFDPAVPRVLGPGETWAGVFSGPGRFPRGSYVRIAFGRFVTLQPPHPGLGTHLLAVTRRAAAIS